MKLKYFITLATFAALRLCVLADVEMKSFQIQGNLTATFFSSNGTPEIIQTEFEVFSTGCTNLIRTKGDVKTSVEYFEYGTEGDSSYFQEKFYDSTITNAYVSRGNSLVQEKPTKPTSPVNRATIRFDNKTPPPAMRGLITPVWLAYASRCYFERNDPTIGDSLFRATRLGTRTGTKLAATRELSLSSPFFLSNYSEFADSALLATSPGAPNATVTSGVFNVLEWTNVFGMAFPCVFELVLYGPGDSSDVSPKLRELMRVRGNLNSIAAPLETPPAIIKDRVAYPVFVNDYRKTSNLAGSIRASSYVALDGRIKAVDELKVGRLTGANSNQTETVSSRRRFVIVSIFGVSVFFLAICAIRNRKQTKQT